MNVRPAVKEMSTLDLCMLQHIVDTEKESDKQFRLEILHELRERQQMPSYLEKAK